MFHFSKVDLIRFSLAMAIFVEAISYVPLYHPTARAPKVLAAIALRPGCSGCGGRGFWWVKRLLDQ
jgi:hypothetical protein